MHDDERDKERIRQVINDWMQATAEGHIDDVLKLMAEDVVFLRPGQPPMRGRGAYADASRGMAGQMKFDGRPDIREIQIVGDRAFVWNHLTLTVTPANGAPMKREGDILSVFRREPGGQWLLWRDANMLT
jgi:uncharacterized protein (TIGR02246 family)